MTDRLKDLYDQQGQSPWLDNLRRGYLTSGELAALRDRGVRGLTSNPSIFQKAIQGSSDYDEQFTDLVRSGASIDDDYWSLVIQDIHGACDVFERVYDESDGIDGYVSVEVAPNLAHDGAGHRDRSTRPARADQPPQPDGQDPRNRRGAPADRADDRRGSLHQRDPDLQPRALHRGDGGLHPRPRTPSRRSVARRPLQGGQRGELLHQPCRHRGRSAARGDRVRRGVGAARQGRSRPGQAGLSAVPRHVPRPALGRPGRPRRPCAAAALGLDVDEEPRLPRHALRGRAHRPAHGEHPARTPRSRRSPTTATSAAGSMQTSTTRARSGRRSRRSASTWPTWLRNWSARACRVSRRRSTNSSPRWRPRPPNSVDARCAGQVGVTSSDRIRW